MRCNLTMKKLSLSDSVTLKPHKLLLVLSLAFVMVSASFLFVLSPLQTAQASFCDNFTAHTWGSSLFGQLGLGQVGNPTTHPDFVAGDAHARHTPTEVPAIAGENEWKHISASGFSTLALNGNGELFAWGANGSPNWDIGLIGLGCQISSQSTPAKVPFPSTVTAWQRVETSAGFSLALCSNDRLYSTGENNHGQLGQGLQMGVGGTAVHRPYFTPIPFPTGANAVDAWVDFATLSAHALAICNNGRLWSWGSNGSGQLGLALGDTADRNTPTLVPNPNVTPPIPGWERVFSSQGSSSAALTTDGRMFVWGNNWHYRLGLDDRSTPADGSNNRHVPTLLPAPAPIGTTWTYISFGNSHTHGLDSNGRLWAWGRNEPGQTGLDTTTGYTTVPAQVGSASNWVSVSAGNMFSVALNARGEMFTWGGNSWGGLGQGTFPLPQGGTLNYLTVPTRVGDYYWDAISAGHNHVVAISKPEFSMQVNLTKHLQKPAGTPAPNVTFTFTVERNSFNGNSTPADIDRIPVIGSITLNPTTVVSPPPPPAGTVTLRTYADILDGVVFTEAGIYSWVISEVQSATGIGPDSSVVFSQAQYDLRVYVFRQPGPLVDYYVRWVTLHRIREADGTIPDVENGRRKVDDLIFVNLYTYDPFITPTGLFLRSGSPYLLFLATGVLVTAYLTRRARKRIEELPIMQ